MIRKWKNELIETLNLIDNQINLIEEFAKQIINKIKNGNKILLMGNGGSAADSQHMAAELVGRYKKDRKAWPAISLTTDTSVLTSLSNDYNFDHVFEKQIEALAKSQDIVIGLSTSGNSENVVQGILKAKEIDCYTIALLGKDGGKLKDIVDLAIVVPSKNTPRIQEVHSFIIHSVCEIVERELTHD